ncbi:MAG: hypothetical protein KDA41_08290 [Planctomycetales bacterium]|nr:hypothetical protein [Planctomycetales bacterium]
MPWAELYEHEELVERFRMAARMRRLASTFLFVGPPGVGKRKFAMTLAQALLCEQNAEDCLDACGNCPSCVQAAAGTHPDLETISRPPDKASIPLELLIGDLEHRNREGLCHRIALKPMRGRRKVAIIDDADYLNAAGANCLLKTLEEPPPKSVIILISTGLQRQLPTIRSRSQIVRFRPLSAETVAALLLQHGLVEDAGEAQLLAEVSGGSLETAAAMRDPELRQFRRHLTQTLAGGDFDGAQLAGELTQFVDAAGKEAPARRARLQQAAGWAAEFYREAMATAVGAAGLTPGTATPLGPDAALAGLDRSLDAMHQVEANANQSSLIEAWIDDLVQAAQIA